MPRRKKKKRKPKFEEESEGYFVHDYANTVANDGVDYDPPDSKGFMIDAAILSTPVLISGGLYMFPPSFLLVDDPSRPGEKVLSITRYTALAGVLFAATFSGWYILRYRSK